MAKVYGAAFLDATNGKWFYRLGLSEDPDSGEVVHESDHIFATKVEAESELVDFIRGLKKASEG